MSQLCLPIECPVCTTGYLLDCYCNWEMSSNVKWVSKKELSEFCPPKMSDNLKVVGEVRYSNGKTEKIQYDL